MCVCVRVCRRSSGSRTSSCRDTWPDLLHSTRTSQDNRLIRTLSLSHQSTSLQVGGQDYMCLRFTNLHHRTTCVWGSRTCTTGLHVSEVHMCLRFTQTWAHLRGALNSIKTTFLKSLQLIFSFHLTDVFRKLSKHVVFSVRKTINLSSK